MASDVPWWVSAGSMVIPKKVRRSWRWSKQPETFRKMLFDNQWKTNSSIHGLVYLKVLDHFQLTLQKTAAEGLMLQYHELGWNARAKCAPQSCQHVQFSRTHRCFSNLTLIWKYSQVVRTSRMPWTLSNFAASSFLLLSGVQLKTRRRLARERKRCFSSSSEDDSRKR